MENLKQTIMEANFENFAIGSKVESIDKHGYFVLNACGFIVKHLGDGHCIIKTFEGSFCSTVSNKRIHEVYLIC